MNTWFGFHIGPARSGRTLPAALLTASLLTASLLTAVLLVLAAAPAAAQQTWKRINRQPFVSTLLAAALPSDSAMVAVGEYGAVHLSLDGGTSWRYFTAGVAAHLRAVAFADRGHGIAVGDEGTITRTTDSGRTWAPVRSGSGAGLRSALLRPDGAGIAVGEAGTILRTEDTGRTWTAAAGGVSAGLNDVAAVGDAGALAVGDGGVALYSADGGRTWRAIAVPVTVDLVRAATTSEAWHVVGANGAYLRSTDAGGAWSTASLPRTLTATYLRFFDAEHGVLAARTGPSYPDTLLIRRTEDGGRTWAPVVRYQCADITTAVFTSMTDGVGVGNRGAFYTYQRDVVHGDTTRLLSWNNAAAYSGIGCSDERNCIALGYYATNRKVHPLIERTTDGGATWTIQESGLPASLYVNRIILPRSVHCFDSLRAIIVCDSGTILRTSDAGQTWRKTVYSNLPEPYQLLSVSFSDARHGIISTYYYFVLRTTDGGETWARDSLPLASSQSYQVDSTTMVALGSRYKIYRTTDGGVDWSTDTIQAKEWASVRAGITFVNRTTGWIAGSRRTPQSLGDRRNSVLLKTTDAGATWRTVIDEELEGTLGGFVNIAFADERNGLVAGEGNTILRTRDGGETWEPTIVPREAAFYFYSWGLAFPSVRNVLTVKALGEKLQYRDDGPSEAAEHAVARSSGSGGAIAARPNPARDAVTVTAEAGAGAAPVVPEAGLYDAFGAAVLDLTAAARRGATASGTRFTIGTSGLASGPYFVRVRLGGASLTLPILVAR